MKRRRTGNLTGLLVVCFVVALAYANHETVLTGVAKWLNVCGEPQRTDYVFPLNGDPNARPFVAAALVTTGWANDVLLLPVKKGLETRGSPWPPSHELSRRVLRLRGVSADKIRQLPGECSNTFDEARALQTFLDSPGNSQATVTVVTSNFHTRRTKWVFRKVLGPTADRVRFASSPVDGFTESNWWQVEDGFVTYLTEYCKFAFYLLRYGSGGYIAASILLLGSVAAVALPIFVRKPAVQPEVAHA
jgi:uncharacterized SAM-binding protein YcdF (DUF218 family)